MAVWEKTVGKQVGKKPLYCFLFKAICSDRCPSKRQQRRDPDTEEKPREDRGRDGRGAATSPGTPGGPEAGRGRKDPPLEPLEGAQPRDTLTSDVWSPG